MISRRLMIAVGKDVVRANNPKMLMENEVPIELIKVGQRVC